MGESLLPCVEVGAGEHAECAVLLLHGLGADGHDLAPIVPYLELDPALAVRFVLPHAPQIPVTINGGMRMPAWYDITSGDLRTRHDLEGLQRSAAQVRALIEREHARGIAPEKLVLAGFSQGGAVALHVGLRQAQRMAGIVALSTYLLDGDALQQELDAGAKDTPIFMAHGDHDEVVQPARGRAARDQLRALGLAPSWHSFPMGHEICLEQLELLGTWLGSALAG
ncbi:MAG: carboxylesterase [Planctomycetota bacterium]|nr:MAG: carboxylesterase [Planctomycetota bacterium]